MSERQDWVLVEDPKTELRPGITVKCDPCVNCGSRHVFVLTRPGRVVDRDWEIVGFEAIPVPHGKIVGVEVVRAPSWAEWRYSRNLFRLVTGNDDAREQRQGLALEKVNAVFRVMVGLEP